MLTGGGDDQSPRSTRSSSPFSQRLQRFLHLYPTTVPFVVLLLGLLLGMAVNPARFATGSNLSTVLTQVTIIGILGIAQTLVILTAGIDLSVGVIMVHLLGRDGPARGPRRRAGDPRLSARPACRRRSAAISTARW